VDATATSSRFGVKTTTVQRERSSHTVLGDYIVHVSFIFMELAGDAC
jgi:hypothetical protein